MAYFQSNTRMLIISNDSFIVGLLTGYCIANHFTLKCKSRSQPLYLNGVGSRFKVIIIDLRELTSPFVEAHLKPLKYINNQYSTPICAIHNYSEEPLSLMLPWIDYFKDENFIEKLDNYIHKYTFNFTRALNNRRKSDRRSSENRRTLPGTVNALSSNQLDDETTLFHKEIDHRLLGVFKIDKDCQSVQLKGKDLELTGKEFKLFNLLAEEPGRVYTTEKIIDHLWPNKGLANKSDLYQYMHLLRRKVEIDSDNPRWILTIKGVGYKLHV